MESTELKPTKDTARKAVRITSFGDGLYKSRLGGRESTVADVLREHHLEANGRRIAVNGHQAAPATRILEGDQVTLVPWVQGG